MRVAMRPARAPDIPISYRVLDRSDETHDVATLRTYPVAGRLPTFAPGQFSMIGIAGVGEVPISISSPAEDYTAHSYTIRAIGAVTQRLVRAGVGDVVTVRGPFGRPWDMASAEGDDVAFIAGGIGIAPLRAAIEDVVLNRQRYGRIIVLIGATTPDDVVFRPWLESLGQAGVDVRLTVDRPGPDRSSWFGNVGLVTELIVDAVGSVSRVVPDDDPGDEATRGRLSAFLCGPDAMMMATVVELEQLGVDPDHIQLTLERNMQCAVGTCGHCQLGGLLICRDGPVVAATQLGDALTTSEL
jgi:anaerobic sulfite reductase subunit B